MSIERKVAVITGASQGIGAALIKAYRATTRRSRLLHEADLRRRLTKHTGAPNARTRRLT